MRIITKNAYLQKAQEKKKKKSWFQVQFAKGYWDIWYAYNFFQLKLSFKNGFQDDRWNVIGG